MPVKGAFINKNKVLRFVVSPNNKLVLCMVIFILFYCWAGGPLVQEPTDDPSEILKPGKTFIHGFSCHINLLKAGIKHPSIIFNIFPAILLLVIILKPSTVKEIGRASCRERV